MEQNEFLIFFQPSTTGFQAFCKVDRRPNISYPYIGILRQGREMSAEECRKFAESYIAHRRKKEPQYLFRVDYNAIGDIRGR